MNRILLCFGLFITLAYGHNLIDLNDPEEMKKLLNELNNFVLPDVNTKSGKSYQLSEIVVAIKLSQKPGSGGGLKRFVVLRVKQEDADAGLEILYSCSVFRGGEKCEAEFYHEIESAAVSSLKSKDEANANANNANVDNSSNESN